MVSRKGLTSSQPTGTDAGAGRSYFTAPSPSMGFIHSGSTLLDCVLSGGYAMGRIINIVGDKATGKSLLAIEAVANFHAAHPDGHIYYNEVESAFDQGYAAALGMPIDSVTFVDGCFTVEDLFEHLTKILVEGDDDVPTLYVVDSLDALSDREELQRDIDKGTYGANKPKRLSEMFRRLVQKLNDTNVTVIFISQVRDKIGITFGRSTTRSGGRALDFYASQVLYLAHIKTLKRTHKKIERATGVRIKVKCDKNKVGLPFRDCEFDIVFGYGINDLVGNVQWLATANSLDRIGATDANKFVRATEKLDDDEYATVCRDVATVTTELWREIDTGFLPTRIKPRN